MHAQLQLEYFDNGDDIQVLQDEVFSVSIFSGAELIPGDKIETQDSFAEIMFENDQSIFLIEPYTSLSVESVAGLSEIDSTSFNLQNGGLRVVASTTEHAPYQIHTQDNSVEIQSGEVIVARRQTEDGPQESIVQVSNFSTITAASLELPQVLMGNQVLSQRDSLYEVTTINTENLFSILETASFKWLDPQQVPGYMDPFSHEIAQESSPEEDPLSQEEETLGEADSAPLEEDYIDIYPVENYKPGLFSFATSVGFLVVGEQIYSNFILAPTVKTENFMFAFKLPLLIAGSPISPENWYRPFGNFVWSFGSDYNWQNDTLTAAFDLVNDLMLKIEMKVNEPDSRFHLFIGQLQNVSFGQSLSLQEFYNAPFSPQRERTGLYLSIDTGVFGLQLLAEEITHEALYGIRMYFRTNREQKDGQIGIFTLLDRGLGKVLHDTTVEDDPLPNFQLFEENSLGYIIPGFDMFIPLLGPEQPFFAFLLSGSVLLLYQNTFEIPLDILWDNDTPNTVSAELGFGGTVSTGEEFQLKYLLAARYYGSLTLGEYAHRYLDQTRLELMRLINLFESQNTSIDTSALNFSVGGEFSFLIKNAFTFGASYYFPITYSLQNSDTTFGAGDVFSVEFMFSPKKIPLSFGAHFRFQNFISLIQNETPFFSDNLNLGGSISVQAGKFVELSMSGDVVLLEDAAGNLQLNSEGVAAVGGMFSFALTVRF